MTKAAKIDSSDAPQLDRKDARHVRSEAAWLEKAMFALTKAEAAHLKWTPEDEDEAACVVEIDGSNVTTAEVGEALAARVKELRSLIMGRRYSW